MQDDLKHLGRIDLFPEQLGIPGVLHFGRYRHAAAGEILGRHIHQGALEICYLAKGKQVYRAAGREYTLSGGDCYWVPPDEPHDSAGRPQEKGVLYWMVLDCRHDRAGLLNLRGTQACALRRALQRMPVRHFCLGPDGQPMLEQFLTVAWQPAGPLRDIRAGELLLRFLLRMLDASEGNSARQPSPPINRMLGYIRANLDKALTVEQLAEIAGLSVSRFKARFREELGVPPGEYVLRCKIEAARDLLRDREQTITQIAMNLGFSSSQYFATVFRRFMLQTPSEYRSETD